MSARFHIKIAKHPTRNKIVLKDREHVARVRGFVSFNAAMLYADNLVREERGMPRRYDITVAEISTAIRAARAFNNPGVHTHNFGEPSNGCPVCDRDPVDFLIDQAIEQNIEAGLR